jgi:hypothetical protein
MRKAQLARLAVTLAAIVAALGGGARPNGWPWP